MIQVRKSHDRGMSQIGWLDSRHTFSFADYHDPAQMGFRSLRVINEDRVAPGMGFDPHGHRDMEIISYIIEGELAHKDSMGNGSIIRPGDVQRMSAGTGVRHSEYNSSATSSVHFLQIWIVPAKRGDAPSYSQQPIPFASHRNELLRVAAPPDQGGIIDVHQDALLMATRLDAGHAVTHPLAPARGAWVQVVKGTIEVNGTRLEAGDGAAIENESAVTLKATSEAEALVFDLA